MFRNLRLYRIRSPWPADEAALSAALERCSFVPCGPLTERRSGWEPPVDGDDMPFARRVGGADLLQLRTQSRLLPAAAIQEALTDRVDEYRSRMGETPSRRVLRRLKEETRDELLPKSLLKSERVGGFCLPGRKILAIDTASETKAERFLDMLRASFEGFECVPLAFNRPIGDLLTALFLGESFPGFSLGEECRMQDVSEKTAVATWRNVDLRDETIRRHVADGMTLTHLGVQYEDLLQCVINTDGVFTKVGFPDGADAGDAEDDPVALLDARFVLLTGTAARLLDDLEKMLDGFAEPGMTQADAA